MPRVTTSHRSRSSANNNSSTAANSSSSNRAKKRSRPLESSEDDIEVSQDQRRDSTTNTSRTRDCGKCRREISELKQRLKNTETDMRRLETKVTVKKGQLVETRDKITAQDRELERLKKEKVRLKKNAEKLTKEKEEAEKQSKWWKKKADSYRTKLTEMENEKARLESKLSNLKLHGAGSSKSSSSSSGGGPGPSTSAAGAEEPAGLFQDMMDNFRELAETQLQCAVCSELFVEAVSVNCGHTFCDHCIGEWRKKKNNCPVCRTDIKVAAPCKVMDEYVDKVYEQFISEGGRIQRNILKEERAKIKADAAAAATARGRIGGAAVNQLVNIVLNRRREEADSSLDSDDTIELHLSGNRDSDSDLFDLEDPLRDPPRANLRTLLATIRTDSDSSDSDFTLNRLPGGRHRRRNGGGNAAISSDEDEDTSSSSSSSESEEEESEEEEERGGNSDPDNSAEEEDLDDEEEDDDDSSSDVD